MSDETGKWLPYNNDGSAHDCRTKAASNGNSNGKELDEKTVLKTVLARLDGIRQDLQKIVEK